MGECVIVLRYLILSCSFSCVCIEPGAGVPKQIVEEVVKFDPFITDCRLYCHRKRFICARTAAVKILVVCTIARVDSVDITPVGVLLTVHT